MLPKDYTEVPQSGGNYMKFKPGKNRFHVLSEAIIGYEYWTKDKKPVRSKTKFTSTPNIKTNDAGEPEAVKHFWAFVVYNYEDNAMQVLELTQSSIQRAMKAKIDNREGDVTDSDFIITKSGEGLTTEYDVDIVPHKEILEEESIKEKAQEVNLAALYEGKDPFTDTTTPSVEGIPF